MPDEKVVFQDGIKNLLDAVRDRLGPRIRERLRQEAGVDEAALKPSYPLAAHDAAVKVFAEELFPDRPIDEATYQFGRTSILHYGRGVLGRALFSVIRLVGPMRMLKRVPDYFRLTNNYAAVTIEVTGATSYLLDHNEVGIWPHYLRGSMQGSGELIGLKDHAVALLDYDGHRAKYRVSWA